MLKHLEPVILSKPQMQSLKFTTLNIKANNLLRWHTVCLGFYVGNKFLLSVLNLSPCNMQSSRDQK